MKKSLLLTFLAVVMAFVGKAQTVYTENLVVSVNGQSSDSIPAEITVTVDSDSTCTFQLKNFMLVSEESSVAVGTITLEGVSMEAGNGYTSIATTQTITIAEGDTEGVAMWMGPYLGNVPIVLSGRFTDTDLYANIDIDMSVSLQQVINVVVGEEISASEEETEKPSTVYTENLVVSVNGQSSDSIPAEITVTVDNDSTCTFQLKNFMLVSEESSVAVGTITLEGVSMEAGDGYTNIATTQTITIAEGDTEGVAMWMGPYLGNVPIVLSGRFTDTDLYANIDIDMSVSLQQVINVVVGEEIGGSEEEKPSTVYTENLVVSVNGQSSDSIPAEITVTVDSDSTCTFQLKNFMLVSGESSVAVGTITLEGVSMEAGDGYTNIATTQTITIAEGDTEGVAMWMGPYLGNVPIELTGRFTDTDLYANIDIDMSSSLQQVINVVVGEEIGGSEEETEKTSTVYNENLVVSVNGQSSDSIPAEITVTIDSDSTCTFQLKNFMLVSEESSVAVGTITLEGVSMEAGDGYTNIATTQTITIAEGDTEGVAMWMGPYLGNVPIVLSGRFTDTDLYANIDIDMSSSLQQVINVVVGEEIGGSEEEPEKTSTVYNENLVVTVNGQSSDSIPAEITVTIDSDSTCTFQLKNFMLVSEESSVAVGTITLEGVSMEAGNGYTNIATTQTITIANGDTEGVTTWLGPMLGSVPIELTGRFTDTDLYANIDIDMSISLQQVINVVVGEQIVDAIQKVTTETSDAPGVYTLSGVRIADKLSNSLPKGIYIVGGKKVIK